MVGPFRLAKVLRISGCGDPMPTSNRVWVHICQLGLKRKVLVVEPCLVASLSIPRPSSQQSLNLEFVKPWYPACSQC